MHKYQPPNWAVPDPVTYKLEQLDEAVNGPNSLKFVEGFPSYEFNSENVVKEGEQIIRLMNMPDLEGLPVGTKVVRYQLPRSMVDHNNRVIGEVFTTIERSKPLRFLNPFLSAVWGKYTVDTETWQIPGILLNPGNPYEMFLTGELFMTWLLPTDELKTQAKIKCKEIEAENTLTLRQSPVPFIYRPVNYGEDSEYWWMSWGFNTDTEEFAKLLEGQPFRFTNAAFGTAYTLHKMGNTWVGNNYAEATKNEVSFHKVSKDFYYVLYVSNSDFMKNFLKSIGLESDNTAWALVNYATINATTDGPWEKSRGEKINGYDCAGIIVKDGNVRNGDTITLTITYTTPTGAVVTSQTSAKASTSQSKIVWFEPINNCIDSFQYIYNGTVKDTDSLTLYMKKGLVYKWTDNNWDGELNPFVYLNNTDGYSILPDPSASTSLITPYSIISNGVMLAENLESHTFKINDIGNDVIAINNNISNLTASVLSLQRYQIEQEYKNSWYNMAENKLISILPKAILSFALSLRINENMELSEAGIHNVPALTFTNTNTPITKLATSETVNESDDNTIPTVKFLLNILYPIGSVYTTTADNPQEKLGGTWVLLDSQTVGSYTVKRFVKTN